MLERLQKVLAEGGVGSRRECEQLIQEGRVEVNREVTTQLGTKVDPSTDSLRVDGITVKISPKMVFAVNKPRGVVSTSQDPSGRMRVIDLIPTDQRVYNVGRLDKDSEGLIIVTNDGALANRLSHPRYGIEKTYLIQVQGHPEREQLDSLVEGVHIAEGLAHISSYRFKRKQKHTTEIEIVLNEGRNREIRRLLALIGHKVLSLHRTGIGSFVLNLAPGGYQRLTSEEIQQLQKNPKRATPRKKATRKPQGSSKDTRRTKAKPNSWVRKEKEKSTSAGRAGVKKKKTSEKRKSVKGKTENRKFKTGKTRSTKRKTGRPRSR